MEIESKNMANYNVQEIVRAVVANLNDLPGPSGQDVEREREEELHRCFSIPRGQQSSTSSVSSPVSSVGTAEPGLGRSLFDNFRVNANYGNVKNRMKSNRKGQEPIRSSSTGQFVSETKDNISKKKIPRMPKPVFKDVCLLPSPEWSEVPRRKAN